MLELTPEQFGYLAAAAPLVTFCVGGAIAWGVAIWNGWAS
jgi:hypothetical protein